MDKLDSHKKYNENKCEKYRTIINKLDELEIQLENQKTYIYNKIKKYEYMHDECVNIFNKLMDK